VAYRRAHNYYWTKTPMTASAAIPLTGRCHCGNIELTFETELRPEQMVVRSCTCSFCTRHGARTTTDRNGRVEIRVHAPDQLSRYQFALRTAEFFVCRRCGVYLAAVLNTAEGASYATVNVNALDARKRFPQQAIEVSYDGEDAARRITRRQENWTPATIRLGTREA